MNRSSNSSGAQEEDEKDSAVMVPAQVNRGPGAFRSVLAT